MDVPITLLVLQHPTETKHPKNTLRLLSLCIPQTRIVIGESLQDFAALAQQVAHAPNDYWLIYPNSKSVALEDAQVDSMPRPQHLILIDATWRKAFKIWQLNPWLAQLPSFHFDSPPNSRYSIRKTNIAHGLSTLEAAAYALECRFNIDTFSLLDLFGHMQTKRNQFLNDK